MDPLATGMLADGSLAADPAMGGSWRGAGGRWLLWPLRGVPGAALLVIAFRGIAVIIFNAVAAPAGGRTGLRSATGGQFRVTLAEVYAVEFGRVHLSFSRQDQVQREQALVAFVPVSVVATNPDLGWNGAGQLNLQAVQVAGITVQDPRDAVVILLALVNGQLMQLGAPVAASGSGVVVSGEPAWLSVPPQISLPSATPGGSDQVAQSQLMNELPAFFQAYASGDSAALTRFGVRGVSVTGPGGAVTFDSISALVVPLGGATRQITVTVIWQLPEHPGSAARDLGMTSKHSVDVLYVGCRPAKRQMVCKRDWSVDRGDGSPMTRTGPADIVMSARRSTVTGRPVPGRPGSREPGSVSPTCSDPAFAWAVFSGSASFKPADHWVPGRSRRLRWVCSSLRPQSVGTPYAPRRSPCPHRPTFTHPLYLYLLGWHSAPLYGWSFDPGRDILCILTSPPRCRQWP